ncbi:MAG TPA: DUF1304 domain-containing protein [Pilimelia sp.]|nr:DUF1304 domain-containing protein [Pilimelia sp.]
MNAVTQSFAVIGALVHIAAFAMESLLLRRPAVQRRFVGHTDVSEQVYLWAFNQGFYNLFLAAGTIGGLIAYHAGHETAGRAVTLYTCAFMVGAGIVLIASDRTRLRAALIQAVPPLIALIAALA